MNKNKILALFLLTWLLVSCSKTNVENTNSENTKNTISTETNNEVKIEESNVSATDEEVKVDSDTWKKLSINSKCVWCRHCVKFASSNFAIDDSTHKAIVISQDNLDNSWVARAIDRCPVRAISIS